jgi:hypothetical protein
MVVRGREKGEGKRESGREGVRAGEREKGRGWRERERERVVKNTRIFDLS